MKNTKFQIPLLLTLVLFAHAGLSQTTNNPFPTPIPADKDVVAVNFAEFATLPSEDGQAPRMMLLVDEPGSQRLFVNTMTGKLYSLRYDGTGVTPYIDINNPQWRVEVQSRGSERGFQSFTFHPQFNQQGQPGYGKFYTYTDTSNTEPKPDFVPEGSDRRSHDTVLLEWTAKNPAAATYDGDMPREIFRAIQPYGNHNAGHVIFNPTAKSDAEDFGLLYIGLADGGSGGDPLKLAQNLNSAFGKILRIDPLGTNSANKKYSIPATNPFVASTDNTILKEIYAYGLRNPQRLGWDAKTGTMLVADIGQNMVEEISPVTAGGNLGWNKWEGSYPYLGREVNLENPRAEAGLIYPLVEFDHADPLLGRTAATGVYVIRNSPVPKLNNLIIFGDNPSGEVFYVNADENHTGGQDRVRRILFNLDGQQRTLLQLIQSKTSATRADMRMGVGNDERLFVLNKHDGIVRVLIP
jgi:hypothetical protein